MYKKDHFKVTGAILLGVQNYWGELKMYIKCMEKIGSLMLYNLSKVDVAISIYTVLRSRDT